MFKTFGIKESLKVKKKTVKLLINYKVFISNVAVSISSKKIMVKHNLCSGVGDLAQWYNIC
jgi:hypothetical protein